VSYFELRAVGREIYVTNTSAISLAESYSDWCDQIFSSLADFAASTYSHHVHLQSFASQVLDGDDGYGHDGRNIVQACLGVLHAFGWIHDWDTNIAFKVKQIGSLRSARARWDAFAGIELNDRQRYLLEVVVRSSIVSGEKSISAEYVRIDAILDDPDLISTIPGLTPDLAEEELDEVVARQLCEAHKTAGVTEYRVTYGGTTWISKAHVLADREIDELRTQGEHDHLDYKRIYKIDSPSDKGEFTKDVLSFANAGGTVSRLLVGVEDNGTFTIPEDAIEHGRSLKKLMDSTLQAIISERTVIAPSILVAHGEHRDGPYVLITISSDIADLPYRFFAKPADAKLPAASQGGEVWVRHGTSKRLATAAEVEALEERARLFRTLFP
jgi:hypothetical protein